MISPVNPKVEFGQVDEATWSECQGNVIDEATVVTYLEEGQKRLVRSKSANIMVFARRKRHPEKTHSGRNETGVDDVELTVKVLKTKIHIVNFAPK